MSSLEWLESVMLADEELGPSELPDVADWLTLTLPPRDSPPQAPAVEFPPTPAVEFPPTPAFEFPQTPAAEIPQTPVVDLSSSPGTSPGSISVGGRKRPRVVEIPRPPVFELSSSPSPSPRPVPVGGISQPPIFELSSSPSTSQGSFPVVGASPSTFAETSSSRSASQGAVPVGGGHKKAKRKRAPKQVPSVEVTVVSPPSLDADEFAKMLARTEWTKQVVNVLPNNILGTAPRRRSSAAQQVYTPCSSWQEFIDRTREAQLKKEDSRVERYRLLQLRRSSAVANVEGPPDPIGSSRAAVQEIYRQRLDPEVFRKFSLFDD